MDSPLAYNISAHNFQEIMLKLSFMWLQTWNSITDIVEDIIQMQLPTPPPPAKWNSS